MEIGGIQNYLAATVNKAVQGISEEETSRRKRGLRLIQGWGA
jgi:hypothetical protein